MASLTIRRDASDDIGIRGLELQLDGEFLVNLSFGKSITVDVTPGSHLLFATNTLYKQQIEFELSDNDTAVFEVSNVVTMLGRLFMVVGGGIYRVRLKRLN